LRRSSCEAAFPLGQAAAKQLSHACKAQDKQQRSSFPMPVRHRTSSSKSTAKQQRSSCEAAAKQLQSSSEAGGLLRCKPYLS